MGYSTPTDTQIHRCPAPYVTWRRGFTYSCVNIVILHSLGINNRKDNACTFSGQAWFISQECLSRVCRYGSNTYRISRTLVSLPFTRAMWAAFHCLQWKKTLRNSVHQSLVLQNLEMEKGPEMFVPWQEEESENVQGSVCIWDNWEKQS